MNTKFTSIFLSLFFLTSALAKIAPANTFKLETKTGTLDNKNTPKTSQEQAQNKIDDLRSRKKENIFVDNLNNLKLFYLQTKLNLKTKDSK